MTTGQDSPALKVRFAHLSTGSLVDDRHLGPGAAALAAPTLGDGTGVRVALLDSGVDDNHPALRHTPIQHQGVLVDDAGRWTVQTDVAGDPVGHGTACAGVLLRQAPGMELTSVRVLNATSRGTGAALLTALRWAVEEGYAVVNLSLSTARLGHRDELHELCDAAAHAGTAVVCAANNRPLVSYPWHFSSVISVGSHAAADSGRIEANPGAPVDFYARGVAVEVPIPGGGSRVMTGNSFAAPHVAALCTRIVQFAPLMKTYQLKATLARLAANVSPTP